MPNRDIKESCRTSPTLALLSHGAERLFWRLTTCADDWGRMEADADVIRALCFPRMLAKVTLQNVRTFILELRRARLVDCYYSSDERHLLFFLTWRKHQRVRASTSKYPDPTDAGICRQLTTHDGNRSGSTVVTGSTVDTVNTALAFDGEPRQMPAPAPTIPPSIVRALDLAQRLGSCKPLRSFEFWKANIRATNNGHVDYAAEVMKAEAWLTANPGRAPKKDLARFLHNWLSRAAERE